MADGGHVCRRTRIRFGTCTNRHRGEHSDQVLKKNPTSGLGEDAITINVYRRTVGRTDGRRRVPRLKKKKLLWTTSTRANNIKRPSIGPSNLDSRYV